MDFHLPNTFSLNEITPAFQALALTLLSENDNNLGMSGVENVS